MSPRGIPSPGQMLAGKYRVEALLGSGGMGIVVAATHVQLQDEVAIKLLRPDTTVPGRSAERLLREARAATRIRSEHVARVFDVGVLDDGSPFLVMERLRGADLASVVASEPPQPVATAVDWILQACEAVVEAHGRGIVHRDLKPANLFRTHRMDGSVCIKVLDFGISKIGGGAPRTSGAAAVAGAVSDETLDPGERDEPRFRARAEGSAPAGVLTATGAQIGSPRYTAPEQVRNASEVDRRADVWSLGAILYELLTGRPAFDAATGEELRRAIVDEPPVPLGRDDVPADLERVILRCLAKDAGERFPDVAALARAMAPFGGSTARTSADRIAAVARVAAPVGEPPTAPESASRADGFSVSQESGGRPLDARRTLAVRASGAVAVIAIAMVAVALLGRDRETTTLAPVTPTAPAAVAPPSALDPATGAPPSAPEELRAAPATVAPPPARVDPAPSSAAVAPRRAPRAAPSAAAAPASASAAARESSAATATPAPSSSLHLEPGALFDGRR